MVINLRNFQRSFVNFVFGIAVIFIMKFTLPFFTDSPSPGSTVIVILKFLYYLSFYSLLLGIFNLIPISPLDGSKILYVVLPEKYYFKILQYERYGIFVVMAMAYFFSVVYNPILPAVEFFYKLILSPLHCLVLGL